MILKSISYQFLFFWFNFLKNNIFSRNYLKNNFTNFILKEKIIIDWKFLHEINFIWKVLIIVWNEQISLRIQKKRMEVLFQHFQHRTFSIFVFLFLKSILSVNIRDQGKVIKKYFKYFPLNFINNILCYFKAEGFLSILVSDNFLYFFLLFCNFLAQFLVIIAIWREKVFRVKSNRERKVTVKYCRQNFQQLSTQKTRKKVLLFFFFLTIDIRFDSFETRHYVLLRKGSNCPSSCNDNTTASQTRGRGMVGGGEVKNENQTPTGS